MEIRQDYDEPEITREPQRLFEMEAGIWYMILAVILSAMVAALAVHEFLTGPVASVEVHDAPEVN